jgi:3-ketosteroid 9alpha-monooxygenase subunit B
VTTATAGHDYVAVPVLEVIQETESAVSVVLDVPDVLADAFRYQPGQFLTLRVEVGGKHRHRCYSLSSAPGLDPRHKVTVKRVEGGLVSNWICSSLRKGQSLLVQPPAGHFVPHALDHDFLLFAGGSGVTPVMSILKTVLASGTGRVLLVYANRDERSVIFADELRNLVSAHPERLTVLHWLETVQGLPGAAQLAALVGHRAQAEAFICGPEPFMIGVSTALEQLGFERGRIHVERFVSLPDEDAEPALVGPDPGGADVDLTVLLDGEEHRLPWKHGEKLLDTMLAANIRAPYSCRVGGCSACMCKLLDGEVKMAMHPALDDRDIAEGWVLSCQSYPVSSSARVEFPS